MEGRQIDLIYSCLKNSGVICFPTETVCALACDATNKTGINRIYKIKSRDRAKALSILVLDIKAAKKYVLIDSKAEALIKKFSPGPVTYVLPNKNLPNWPETVGIRIPDHPIAQEILKNYPNPLVGTSVNISGKASAKTVLDIPEELKNLIDMIVEDSSEKPASSFPSTIIDLSKPGKVSIIREGAIRGETILHYYHHLA
jgi:L-threonylcarbamoyladenylate synthase